MGRGKKSRGIATTGRASVPVGKEPNLEAEADVWLASTEQADSVPTVSAPRSGADEMSGHYRFIDSLNKRIRDGLPANIWDLSQQDQLRARGKALGVLLPSEQRRLAHIGSHYTGLGRDRVREQAAEMLILTNAGFIENLIRVHEARGIEAEELRQECRLAIYDAIRRFDPDNGASFLAYAEWRMRGAISEAIRSNSRLVRLKSRASEISDRVQRAIKLWEANATIPSLQAAFPNLRLEPKRANESDEEYAARQAAHIAKLEEIQSAIQAGHTWTQAVIAEITGDRPERVEDIIRWVTSSYIRLDAPIATKDGEIEVASAVADPLSDVEGEVMEAGMLDALVGALDTLTPYERRLIELYYGVGREVTSGPVQQKDIYDGVYIDDLSIEHSAEQSVIADRRALAAKRRGGVGTSGNPSEKPIKIRTALQRELNERYERGELIFRPNTPEAKELFELSGVPPTSATVQETLSRIYEKLAPRLSGMQEDTISRGNHVLEHSEQACKLVRQTLRRQAQAAGGVLLVPGYGTGKLSVEEIDNLKPGKPAKSGIGRKGALRRVAEATGLVNPATGRLTFAPSSETTDEAMAPSPTPTAAPKTKSSESAKKPAKAKQVKPADLVRANVLQAGEHLVLFYKGAEYSATLLDDGRIQLVEEQKRTFSSPSSAAEAAKGVRADPGWDSWHVEREGRWVSLATLRAPLLRS